MHKLIRITTVPLSLEKLLEGQLNFMQAHFQVTAISSDETRLKNFGRELGLDTYAVEMTREITPGKDLRAVWKLYKYFKKEKPLIVHTHTPKAGIAGMVAARMAGVPIRLHTVAGLPLLEATGMTRNLLEIVEKLTYTCATRVYPNSRKICDFLITENYAPKDKFKVIGKGSSNGIDTGYFDPDLFTEKDRNELRDSLGIPRQDVVFVFVGRLVKDKGINELVHAFEELHRTYPNISLLLVGPLEQHLDPLETGTLEIMEQHNKIFEAGFQHDVRPFLSSADILAFPSYREGFPNVVMQAGALGLPAIVTDINGCNEIIDEGRNGRIVPVRNTRALYEAMEEMIINLPLRRRMAERARAAIVEDYERQQLWEALLEEYLELEKEYQEKLVPTTV